MQFLVILLTFDVGFARYRWAFVGNQCGTSSSQPNADFIPHVTRIARLMDAKVIIDTLLVPRQLKCYFILDQLTLLFCQLSKKVTDITQFKNISLTFAKLIQIFLSIETYLPSSLIGLFPFCYFTQSEGGKYNNTQYKFFHFF